MNEKGATGAGRRTAKDDRVEASVVEPAKAGGKEEAEKTDVGGQQGVGKHRKSKVDKTSGETTRVEKGKGKLPAVETPKVEAAILKSRATSPGTSTTGNTKTKKAAQSSPAAPQMSGQSAPAAPLRTVEMPSRRTHVAESTEAAGDTDVDESDSSYYTVSSRTPPLPRVFPLTTPPAAIWDSFWAVFIHLHGWFLRIHREDTTLPGFYERTMSTGLLPLLPQCGDRASCH